MAIYKKTTKAGKVRWYIDYREPGGGRKRQVFDTKRDAQDELAKRKSLIAEGRYLDVKKEMQHTLGELLTHYHETFQEQASFKTLKANFLPIFAEHFGCRVVRKGKAATYEGGPLLSQINLRELEAFRNLRLATPLNCGKPRSKSTVNREMACVGHMLNKAVAWQMMGKSPLYGVRGFMFKEPEGRLRFLSENEAARLLAECSDYLRPIVEAALFTGMRRGEVLGLKWESVRNGHIYLTVTKTNELLAPALF